MSQQTEITEPVTVHVLFVDVAGYSKLSIDDQAQIRKKLREFTQRNPVIQGARDQDNVVICDAGDGMALAFFDSPVNPIACAVQLSEAMSDAIPMRMGINSGLVYRIFDVNSIPGVAGDGINVAQRVMNAGAVGHILLNESTVLALPPTSPWLQSLQNIGEWTAKHDLRLNLYNLFTGTAGTPLPPSRGANEAEATVVAKKPINMLFAGAPRLGRFFTAPWWLVFTIPSAAAFVGLWIPARLIGIHSIPLVNGTVNVGFYHRWHWSLMYTFVIPLILTMSALITGQMAECVNKLVASGRIAAKGPLKAPSYQQALSAYLATFSKPLWWSIFGVVALILILDTHDLWPGFASGHFPRSRVPDWDTAFNAMQWVGSRSPVANYAPPSRVANLIFDLTAYLFEGTAVFLELFWMMTFASYLFAFSRLIGGGEKQFQFVPPAHDLEYRLGLSPMGRLFDNFLTITLIVQGFAFYHRLYDIALHRNQSLGEYVRKTLSPLILPLTGEGKGVFNVEYLGKVFDRGNWGWDGVDMSTGIYTVFMLIPVCVVSYLPLYRIKKLIEETRDRELAEIQPEMELAIRANDESRIKALLHRKEFLEKTNIWPNGDARARKYLSLILLFAAGAVAPPLLVVVLAVLTSDVLRKQIETFTRKE